MIKIGNESVAMPLRIIIEESLKNEYFRKHGKKTNVAFIHKKEDKTLIKNYHPISWLTIFGKLF